MKAFAIMDDVWVPGVPLGTLTYNPERKEYRIQINRAVDPALQPPILAAFAEKGEAEVPPKWSRRWVEERVVPPNRQNIGSILRANGLTEYDDFHFLRKFSGRCGQDDIYLIPIEEPPS